MPQIQISEQLFHHVQQRAAEAGFACVDDYVADMLQQDVDPVWAEVERLLTPERLAEAERAAAQIAAGQGRTLEQFDEELQRRRERWLRDQ